MLSEIDYKIRQEGKNIKEFANDLILALEKNDIQEMQQLVKSINDRNRNLYALIKEKQISEWN